MHHPSPPRAAFTLLELLVATSVTALVTALMLNLFGSVTSIWRSAEERIDTEREARAALERIRRDLEGCRPGPRATLRIGHDPDLPATERAFEALYAVVSLPQADGGELCTVGYRCVWNAEAGCYELVRFFLPHAATIAALTNPSLPASTAPHLPSATGEPLARYLWDLTFRPCEAGEPAALYPDQSYTDPLPRWVEIRFKALGPLAAERLAGEAVTPETWRNPSDPLFARFIAPHARSYTLRVALHAGTAP